MTNRTYHLLCSLKAQPSKSEGLGTALPAALPPFQVQSMTCWFSLLNISHIYLIFSLLIPLPPGPQNFPSGLLPYLANRPPSLQSLPLNEAGVVFQNCVSDPITPLLKTLQHSPLPSELDSDSSRGIQETSYPNPAYLSGTPSSAVSFSHTCFIFYVPECRFSSLCLEFPP